MRDSNHLDRKKGRSLFGPMMLIAIGIFFLLYNTGRIPALNWGAALQLWPLLLVFMGLNIIVQQAPRPFGTFLSGVVSIGAITIFGYVLFSGPDNPIFNRLGIADMTEYRRESISFGAPDLDAAEIELDIDTQGANIFALEDSNDLIAGEVTILGRLEFSHDVISAEIGNGDKAIVSLDDDNNGLWFANPGTWMDFDGERTWQIGLDPDVPIDLQVDSGAGPLVMDLTGNKLTDLDINSGAGPIELQLPGGDYNADIDLGAGAVEIFLPPDGRHFINIDGAAGNIELFLPRGMEAQIDVDSGAGRVDLDDRFERIRGDGDDRDGVWETAGFDRNDPDHVVIQIDMGAGSLTIAQPQGR